MRRPTIKRGPASSFAGPVEIILEIHSSNLKCGALLSVREQSDGTLRVEIYRADSQVRVLADPKLILASPKLILATET